jgi:hypothetical protein
VHVILGGARHVAATGLCGHGAAACVGQGVTRQGPQVTGAVNGL